MTRANIIYQCSQCPYKTKSYHNPLKVQVVFLTHIIKQHGSNRSYLNMSLALHNSKSVEGKN